MRKVGIIGGSGLDNLANIKYSGEADVITKYGTPSMPFRVYESVNCQYYFLSRHGAGHKLAPHKINYRANVMAFKELGVEEVISFSAVGGINTHHSVGTMLLLDNAMDFTSGRDTTFFNDEEVVHIDLTQPFCSELRDSVNTAALSVGVPLFKGGVYLCTNGPRLETAAEIKMYRAAGADVVGMTLFPEVALLRECEICYACVALITNTAAGVAHNHKLTSDEVVAVSTSMLGRIGKIIDKLDQNMRQSRTCMCSCALNGARIS